MSLDVWLMEPMVNAAQYIEGADLCKEHGLDAAAECLRRKAERAVEDRVTLFQANITHNLGRMAEEAGIYQACWRPEEIGATKAGQLVELLRDGLVRLKADPRKYQIYSASNGWGLYENFVPWVEKYLVACMEYPDAEIVVSR